MSDKIVCPICSKKLKYLNNAHLKTHGYSSEKEFLRDYPGFQLKTSEVKSSILKHLSTVNSNSELQSQKGKQGWTKERRQLNSEIMKQVTYQVHHSPEYKEVRAKIYRNRLGMKKKYIDRHGKELQTRSKLERFIAYYLDYNQIDYLYEILEIPYIRDDGSEHIYLPDFYVPSHNLVIEGKYEQDQLTPISRAKRQATLDLGYKYIGFVED